MRGHPAFWVFLAVMIPAMVLGGLGGLYGIVLPVSHYFRVPLGLMTEAGWKAKLGRWHIGQVMAALEQESQAILVVENESKCRA
jgi:hypothetical protein